MRKNIFIKLLAVAGVALFVLIAYVVISSTSTTVAIVPNQSIKAGTLITSEMVDKISIPSNVPEGYITDASSVIGQKLRVSVEANQLLYINDVMTSWEELIEGEDIPDNYVITSILIPSERAIGGLITAGDTVDIFGLPNNSMVNMTSEDLREYLGQMGKYDYYGTEEGLNGFWVLSNVKILETDSTLSSLENSSISTITGSEDGQEGAYYIMALSYSDYQKLRLSEKYLSLWLSLVPKQNETEPPLYDEMRQSVIKMLQDSQNQPEEYLQYEIEDLEEDEKDKPLHEISNQNAIENNKGVEGNEENTSENEESTEDEESDGDSTDEDSEQVSTDGSKE